MGLINIGPETKSLFQTIKDFIAKVAKKLLSYVDTEFRDKYNAEKRADKDKEMTLLAFETLNSGLVADPSRRHEVYDALRKNVEAHNKAMDDLGSGVEKFWRSFGQVVVSNEAMLGLYKKHPELQKLADKFHQTHGKAMTNQGRDGGPEALGGYLEAIHTQSGLWLNKLENILEGYDRRTWGSPSNTSKKARQTRLTRRSPNWSTTSAVSTARCMTTPCSPTFVALTRRAKCAGCLSRNAKTISLKCGTQRV